MSGKGLLFGEDNKWAAIHRLVRDKKLGILAIQESHLTDEDIEIIHDLYGRRLYILNSKDPTNASAARGVAFVLNKELVDVKNATLTEIIPGRAITLKTKWHADTNITILNVYAPNNTRENEEFWNLLKERRGNGQMPQPDILLGDFNVVEEALDTTSTRRPTRPNKLTAQTPSRASFT